MNWLLGWTATRVATMSLPLLGTVISIAQALATVVWPRNAGGGVANALVLKTAAWRIFWILTSASLVQKGMYYRDQYANFDQRIENAKQSDLYCRAGEGKPGHRTPIITDACETARNLTRQSPIEMTLRTIVDDLYSWRDVVAIPRSMMPEPTIINLTLASFFISILISLYRPLAMGARRYVATRRLPREPINVPREEETPQFHQAQ